MRRPKSGNGSGLMDALLNRDRLVIRDSQLIDWLEIRNEHLKLLRKRRVAGGTTEVSVQVNDNSG